jgi:methyl-accepting chemotaxis protein
MCDAIEKVFIDTASGIDTRVSELKAMVSEIDEGVNAFKEAMRNAANSLVERVQEVMAHYEDITAKLQESPFNGDMPTFLEKQNAGTNTAG